MEPLSRNVFASSVFHSSRNPSRWMFLPDYTTLNGGFFLLVDAVLAGWGVCAAMKLAAVATIAIPIIAYFFMNIRLGCLSCAA
jgi:hypothetical protein